MVRWLGPRTGATLLFIMFAALAGGSPAAAQAPGPALPEPAAMLDAALHCPAELSRGYRGAVLLVPGTGLSGPENWDWGYRPALEAEGFVVCTVDMKDHGMGDIQVSAGRIVHAVRSMHAATGQPVALVGYSQGGLDIRWALKYWPDIRAMVSDVVGLAPANHGADSAGAICQAAGACAASIWQMVPGSRLTRAVNAGGETFAGIDYTIIYSRDDGVVVPPAERSALRPAPGAAVANIELQTLCPSSQLAHIGFPSDGAVYALVLDALLRPGPADPTRLRAEVCGALVPGVTPEVAAAKATELTNLATARIFGAPVLTAEPPLAAYAAGDAPEAPRPPATGTSTANGRQARLAFVGALLAAAGAACASAGLLALRRAQRRSSSM